jgi:hypothetical protein
VSLDLITDGTQTTIHFTELAGRPDLWVRGAKQGPPHQYSWIRCGGCPCSCALTVSNPGGCWGCFKNGENYVAGSSFDGKHQASGAACCIINCTNEIGANFSYSFHPGCAGLAMCDGSVHMISENISLLTFCNMVSFRGREVVTDSSF